MLKIGITGGIGSGKSIVSQVFEHLGIPVFNADAEAKKILDEDASLKEKIKDHFGKDIYDKDGKALRKKLAGIVFHDPKELKKLNSIIHPAVRRKFEKWAEDQTSYYVVKEAAILYESGADKGLDRVIAVTAPEDLKIERTMKRDKLARKEVLARMSNQMTETERNKRADFLIYNDGQQLVIPQVLELHEKFKKL